MARLSQDQKINLLTEINATFGIFGIADPIPDETDNKQQRPDLKLLREIVVCAQGNGKTVVFVTKSIGYDFVIQMSTGRLLGKIFLSPRNFASNDAIAKRYHNFLTSKVSTIIDISHKGDIWILFIKTPIGWEYFIVPLDESQLLVTKLIFNILRGGSPRTHFFMGLNREINEILKQNEKLPIIQKPILVRFLSHWIKIHEKSSI